MRTKVGTISFVAGIGLLALATGCPFFPPPPGPEAVLEGRWTVTPADPGEFDDVTYEAEFDSQGDLVELKATRADGATATLQTDDATTELDGSDVTITVPRPTGTRVFEGVLSDDKNTMTGSITQEIDLGDLEIILPGGELTFERIVTDDPCADVTCDPGFACDPDTGECVAVDPCEGVTCDPGETCVEGECVPEDPCAGVTCATCEACVEGVCQPLVGDPVTGEAFYTANGCAACHGDDASGGLVGPSLIGEACGDLYDVMSGNVTHTGGTVDGVTEQDAADLAAWLAGL